MIVLRYRANERAPMGIVRVPFNLRTVGKRPMSDVEQCTDKLCAKCGVRLPLASFGPVKIKPDGLNSRCRPCCNAYNKENRGKSNKNPEKYAEQLLASRLWKKSNPERTRMHARRSKAKRKDSVNQYSADWRKNNPEHFRRLMADWKSANKGLIASYSAARRANERSAIPKWGDAEFESFMFAEAYELSAMRKTLTGVAHHVDHIVPLKSDLVCGLHYSSNIRVIPAFENISKSNRYWPEMPI